MTDTTESLRAKANDVRKVFYGIDWGATADETAVAFTRLTEGEATEVLAVLRGPAAYFVASALVRLEAAERDYVALLGYVNALAVNCERKSIVLIAHGDLSPWRDSQTVYAALPDTVKAAITRTALAREE